MCMVRWVIGKLPFISSYSGFVLVYVIYYQVKIFRIHPIINYAVYTVVLFLFSTLTLCLVLKIFQNGETLSIKTIKPLEVNSVPLYLALFVIAFELNPSDTVWNSESLVFMLFVFFIWGKLGRISYFNIFWLFLGYRYYEVDTERVHSIVLITK